MAATGGGDRASVADSLRHEAYRFDFFQAVRLLEWMARDEEAASAEPRHPVGQDSRPDAEIVRFRALPSLSFPTGSIRELRVGEKAESGKRKAEGTEQQAELDTPESLSAFPSPLSALPGPPPEMVVACMGLFGPSGPLPDHYTAMVIQRTREHDYSLRDFLDLFNHRTTSLFYRAWEKNRFTVAYERPHRTAGGGGRGAVGAEPEAGDDDALSSSPRSLPPVPRPSSPISADSRRQTAAEDLFTQCLYCLIGWGTGGLRGRLAVDDEAVLFYSGHFAHFPRSAIGLELIVADYFELPAEVRQFRGQWLYLSPEDQGQLPWANGDGGRGAGGAGRGPKCLGDNFVVGQRVWDVQSKFRVRLGPLAYRQFRRFMPSGDAIRPLCQTTRSYAGAAWDFDVQPVLKAAEVPWCQLGGPPADGGRLGWNMWIRSRELDHDVDDAVFYLEG